MRRYLCFLVAMTLATACVKDSITTQMPDMDAAPEVVIPEGATAGEAIIKFSPEMEEILDQTMTRSQGETTRSGIPSTDEVLDILGAYSFERIFPVDMRNEERTRKAGLHLWYIVRFNENEDLKLAFERLSKLGEVDKLQCNRPIERAYINHSNPMFVSCAEADTRAMTRATTMPFNDPEMYRQWCYINDGTASFASERAGVLAGSDAGCAEAWELCTGDEDIIVAVMDEAVEPSRPYG